MVNLKHLDLPRSTVETRAGKGRNSEVMIDDIR